VRSVVLGPGLQLDLGAQIRRQFALLVRAEGASLILFSGVSACGIAERTPLRLGLEFAAGLEPRSWIFGWHASMNVGFVLR
jgi:hypothetical protein